MSKLTHLDQQGHAHMVDVGHTPDSERQATAEAYVSLSAEALRLIMEGGHKKGDVFAVARIAGIQAAKKCSELIPLCHPLLLTSIKVELEAQPEQQRVRIESTCKLRGQTGVEMEALTAVSVAALTLYDMCKAVDKSMVIGDIRLLDKQGGKSGHWQADSSG